MLNKTTLFMLLFIGCSQQNEHDSVARVNGAILTKQMLKDIKIFNLPTKSKDCYWNYQYYVVSVNNNMNEFVDQMFKNGIHLMKEDVWDCSAYDFSNHITGNFLVAKKYNKTLVRIPNSSFLSKKDILRISNQMNSL